MKKLLKINEVAQITGLSVNGIRYYEREGVVHPIYRGKYRYYSLIACAELQRAVNYRDMGFSLPDTVRLVHCTNLKELEDAMLQQRQTIAAEIAQKQRVLSAVENRTRQLNEIKLQYGRCSLIDSPAYYMRPALSWHNGAVSILKDYYDDQDFFAKCGPAVAPAILIPLQELLEQKEDLAAFTGPGILASDVPAELRSSPLHEETSLYFSPRPCIYTVFSIEDGTHLRRSALSHVFQYAEQQNLHLSGDAYTYRIAALKSVPDANAGIYVQAWFPVGKK